MTDSNQEDTPTSVMIAEAVDKARNAFKDHLYEVHLVEPGYFKLKIQVDKLDMSFKEVLERVIWEEEPFNN
jgi:hypothetical protein